jgi:hypothetical protein
MRVARAHSSDEALALGHERPLLARCSSGIYPLIIFWAEAANILILLYSKLRYPWRP